MITALVALARREHTGGPKWIRVLIAALVLVAGLGSLPRLGDYFPGQLFVWGSSLALGKGKPAWAALWVSPGLIVLSLTAAWRCFVIRNNRT
jgi:hypothetical protein